MRLFLATSKTITFGSGTSAPSRVLKLCLRDAQKSHIRESMFQQLELFERLERFELFISLLVVLQKSKLKSCAGTVIRYGP
jgi:hypothetical protein